MLKKYKDFLNELDLGLGDTGGGEKKQEAPDPEKEIEKMKEKKRKKAQKERAEQLDNAEEDIRAALKKTPKDFNSKFEKRILDALDDDDRVIYHNLITDIQSYEVPKAREQQVDAIEAISPIIKAIQKLNSNEYKG